jgi:hypothetical protein
VNAHPSASDTILELLRPVERRLLALDLSDAMAASQVLDREFPLEGELGRRLKALGQRGIAEGWLCHKGEAPARFSRLAKAAGPEACSVDAVLSSGEGLWHRHTRGEVNCLLATQGEPRFCGFAPGWAVFAPGSAHVPSVTGGEMLIFYLLPGGEVEWTKP